MAKDFTKRSENYSEWYNELVMDAYNLAVKEQYRFGCYGDAMLIMD